MRPVLAAAIAVAIAVAVLAACDTAEPPREPIDPLVGYWVAFGPDAPLPAGEPYATAVLTITDVVDGRVRGTAELGLGTCTNGLCSPVCRALGTLDGTRTALALGPDAEVLPRDIGVRFSVTVAEPAADALTVRLDAASDACPAPATVTLRRRA
ncbi:hypothetical protein [Rubrivirga sp. IMCC45206]|uniref:hypothetical protein n=1 Tax=Rubrivirga sp. IMCC45206 TaxID=3391614 RepID=UPI0039900234